MQQLLSITASSERFSSTGSELSNELDKGSQTSEFARILMSGEGAKKATSSNELNNVSAEFAQIRAAELANESQAKQKPDSGNNLQRIDFDGKNVGEPVEAPILELLEQMQAILPKDTEQADGELANKVETGEAELADLDVSPELLDKLSALLEQMGTERLSAEQRQQLADQFAQSLNAEQRQLFVEAENEQLMALLNAKQTDAQSAEIEQQQVQLLERLQQLGQLADKAVSQLQQGQTVSNEETTASLNELKGWLKQQLATIVAKGETAGSDNTQVDPNAQQQGQGVKSLTVTSALTSLSQAVEQANDLSTQQKQQLQAIIDKMTVQTQQTPKSDNASAAARLQTAMNDIFKQLSAEQPASSATTVKADKSFAISATAAPTDSGNADAKSPANGVGDTAKVLNMDADKKATLDSMLANKSAASANERVTETASALNAERLTPTSTQQQIDSPTQVVSTQAGGVKASELSSTLQSSMQAIQKPFDPQQAEASQKLQERIQIMLSKNVQRADIRLDPPELGQLHVRVNMNGEQASVQFQAQSAQAKDALEAAMPRLREMLEQQGVALADTEVAEQQQQTAGHSEDGRGQRGSEGEVISEHEIMLDDGKPVALGNVDFYV